MVDGAYYLKGMAVYADDLPKGIDIRFNTNKSLGTPMFKGWMGNYYKCLSRQQREGIVGLYETLFHKKVYVKNKKLIIVSV